MVKLVGADGRDRAVPVGRLQISRFIESDGRLWRLRVYALSRQALAEHLATAKDKCRQLGIPNRLKPTAARFAWFRSYTQYEVTDETDFEMHFDREPQVGVWAADKGLRDGSPGEDCNILALGTFDADQQIWSDTWQIHPPRRPRLRPLWHARPHRRLLQ